MQTWSQFSINFHRIGQISTPLWAPNASQQNHLKIDSGSFWRQSGINLVLQGRIWMDSERLGLECSLIWARFCLYFRMDRAWLLQTITRWTISISCCTHHGIVAFTLHFLADVWCGGVRIAPGIVSKYNFCITLFQTCFGVDFPRDFN